MNGRVRLDRALSKLGLASRTLARELIAAGRVSVDGHVTSIPDVLVSPERQAIHVDGTRARRQARRLIAFHKPRGVVTTRRDPEGRRTVFDVLGPAGEGLHAIGRLDLASTGLLLLTNDTRISDRLTDPASAIRRRYVVTVRGRLDPAGAERLEHGIDVERRDRRQSSKRETLVALSVEIQKASNRETHVIVELAEGKNRELRRMFEALGHDVTRVHRVAFGRYEIGDLQPGRWREEHATAGMTGTRRRTRRARGRTTGEGE